MITNLNYKLVVLCASITLCFSGCSTTGGGFVSDKIYKNKQLETETPVAVNIEQFISFPSEYMNAVDSAINNEISLMNRTVPMKVIVGKDRKYANYVKGAISPGQSIKIKLGDSERLVKYKFDRHFELSLAKGFETMIEDGEYFDDYEYSVLVRFSNTAKEKNFAASMLSALNKGTSGTKW